MMRRKKWKGSKAVLPLLLLAMMVVEPVGTVMPVHAEEIAPQVAAEDSQQDEIADVNESVADDTEETKADAAGGSEQGSDAKENEDAPKTEEGGDEGSDSDHTDKKDEASEDPSDAEEQESGEDASPEEETISGNELEEAAVSGNDLEEEKEDDQDDDTEGFSDMPDSYRLTTAQQRQKEVLAGEVGNINEADEGIMYVRGEVMVAAASQEEAELIARAYNAEIKSFENGLLLLGLQEGDTVAKAVTAAASARNRLPAVWPNYYRYTYAEEAAADTGSDVIEIEETEYEIEDNVAAEYADEEDVPTLEAYEKAIASYNDPALSPTHSQYQWQHVAVGSPYAWAEGYTGAGVKVAILDTGVMAAHNELTIVAEADTTGRNTVTGAGCASDLAGHGTHVAGIVGAKANNNAGGVGIAPDAELYAVRVLGTDGENSGTDYAIAQGIIQAAKWDVDVINMSLGGPGYNQLCQNVVTDAYKQGIAIFVSAGNDGASCINYPAHYDHIICVAATDQNNSRADFSTYGSWVDLSAPGVAIWSTYNDGGYAVMDGTSMACPVAVGEAAVILGGDASLGAMAKNDKKVDALEKKMKSNTVKASGGGIGSGVTSLTRVFKLSAASAKPQAPGITIVPDDKSKAQKVTVTITAQSGMRIYYTDNGKNPVYKNGLPDANTRLYVQPFEIKNNAKGTIKAIAVNESGTASAVKSAKYTLQPYVNEITVSGVQQVAAGKTIQLTAEVLPAYATNKKVTWNLYTVGGEEAAAAKDNISINATSGKITAKAGATVGARYTARATAKDGSGKYGEYIITVIANTKIASVKFNQKSVTLNLPTDNTGCDLAQYFTAAYADGTGATAADFKWSSNNKAVASVNGNGVVIPHKAGKATITALANDSSGKKAACTVTVKQLVTDIQISGASSIAAGKSVTFKAAVLPADATVKKVTWSVVDAAGAELAADKGVKINAKNGKLTTTAAAKGSYTVLASAADGSAVVGRKTITVQEGAIASLAFASSADKKISIFRKKVVPETQTSAAVNVTIKGTTDKADLDAYEVSSSNPGIASVSASRSGEVVTLTITATGRAAGKTNVTIAATDGSNKKITCAVTVNNPVTKIHISSSTKTSSSYEGVDMIVIKGKSLQLKATLESEYGAVSNKSVKWSINAPAGSGVSINKSGKVSASKAAESIICTVTAEAEDGSGAKATYTVAPLPGATYVSVPALTPKPGTIWAWNPMPNIGGVQQIDRAPIKEDVVGGYVEAVSSNPKAMEVLAYYNPYEKNVYGSHYSLLLTAHEVKKDTVVTITVRATDGSGKKSSYKVLVTNSKLD